MLSLVHTLITTSVILLLSACGMHSISSPPGSDNHFYQGELTDREVFGSVVAEQINEKDIELAL